MSDERTGRPDAQYLSVQEWAEIKWITREIVDLQDLPRDDFESQVRQLLARKILAANKAYDEALLDETLHKWEFGEHHISQCSRDWCGRYRGQRRDSTEATS